MSRFNVSVILGPVGLPTGVCVVEFLDDQTTRGGPRRAAVREVVAARELPADLPRAEVVRRLAELAAPLGPGARVVFGTDGSREVVQSFRTAYREGLLANLPVGVTIVSGSMLTADEAGVGSYRVGDSELILSLRDMVKSAAFTLPEGEGIEELVKASQTMALAVKPEGTLKFPSRKDEGRVFALALALYPQWHPTHLGRRFTFLNQKTGHVEVTESLGVARGRYGSLADSLP